MFDFSTDNDKAVCYSISPLEILRLHLDLEILVFFFFNEYLYPDSLRANLAVIIDK